MPTRALGSGNNDDDDGAGRRGSEARATSREEIGGEKEVGYIDIGYIMIHKFATAMCHVSHAFSPVHNAQFACLFATDRMNGKRMTLSACALTALLLLYKMVR
jgi:hypothetical protein